MEEEVTECNWMPILEDCQLMMYLRACRSMAVFAGMCNGGSAEQSLAAASRDDCTILSLKLLHKNDYDTAKALQDLASQQIPVPIQKRWTDEDQKQFIRGMKKEGKNFFNIRSEFLPHKNVSELVEFYYSTKMTTPFPGTKLNKRRRITPNKIPSNKSLIETDRDDECASSDESGEGSNDMNDSNFALNQAQTTLDSLNSVVQSEDIQSASPSLPKQTKLADKEPTVVNVPVISPTAQRSKLEKEVLNTFTQNTSLNLPKPKIEKEENHVYTPNSSPSVFKTKTEKDSANRTSTTTSLNSLNSLQTSNKIKIKNGGAIDRVQHQIDQMTCIRTDWSYNPCTDAEWYKKMQDRKRKSEKEEKKVPSDFRESIVPINQQLAGLANLSNHGLNLNQPLPHNRAPDLQFPIQNRDRPEHSNIQTNRDRAEIHPPMNRDRSDLPHSQIPLLPHPPDAAGLMNPFLNSLERHHQSPQQQPRLYDNFGFRHSPNDLARPHTGFLPRSTPTSIPSSMPGFQAHNSMNNCMPTGLPMDFLQYHLMMNSNNFRLEQEQDELRRLNQQIELSQRLMYASGGLPPQLNNPAAPNPAFLFPPGFHERMLLNMQPPAGPRPVIPNRDFFPRFSEAQLAQLQDPQRAAELARYFNF